MKMSEFLNFIKVNIFIIISNLPMFTVYGFYRQITNFDLSNCLKFPPAHIRHSPPSLTHWGRMTHICVNRLPIIGSDDGLAPGRHQAIIWTNAGILLIRTSGTHFSEILSKIHTSSLKKMHLKMSSAKWRHLCPGVNVLIQWIRPEDGFMVSLIQIRFNKIRHEWIHTVSKPVLV